MLDNNNNSESQVLNFYKHKTVLITGVTGFIGKVLLEKLLRVCHECDKIYVLLRPKKELSPQQRLDKLLGGWPYTFHLADVPERKKKVVAVNGDITLHDLGLSDADRRLLTAHVNIVVHLAATINFVAPIRESVVQNVVGTQNLVRLCYDIARLDVFVHVSTAYANCHLPEIDESIRPLKVATADILALVDAHDDATLNTMLPTVLEGRPNTYTFTKAMAENVLIEHQGRLPIVILRPSIVTQSWQEPTPGWTDSVNGPAGLGILAALGILRTMNWNCYAMIDVTPVDIVVNQILILAWYTAMRPEARNRIRVFNLTSSHLFPITWEQLFDNARVFAMESPSIKLIRPIIENPKQKRANPVKHAFLKLFSHLLFAYLVDCVLWLCGYKQILVRITRKMHHAFDILKPFTNNEWKWHADNIVEVQKQLTDTDNRLFFNDVGQVSMLDYCYLCWFGCRRYILKEDDSNIPKARKRMKMITIGYNTFLAFLYLLLLFTIGPLVVSGLKSLLAFVRL